MRLMPLSELFGYSNDICVEAPDVLPSISPILQDSIDMSLAAGMR
jgi:hypothetical protein